MVRTLALTALLVAVLAAPARADYYAEQRPANANVYELVDLARDFWAQRNVTGCPTGIMAWHAPDLSSGDGGAFGRGGNCVIWINDIDYGYINDPAPTRATLAGACTLVFHEVGHALGLGHTEHGVMSVVPDTPYACRQWTHPLLKAYAARERAKERKARRQRRHR